MVILLDSEFLWQSYPVTLAIQKHSFCGINQSDCEKVIDDTCSFFFSLILVSIFSNPNDATLFPGSPPLRGRGGDPGNEVA